MKSAIKTQWVAALRSGAYKKTKGVLSDSEGFCCLGVLCDLHRKAHPDLTWDARNGVYEYLGVSDLLPHDVMEWAGLADAYGGDVRWHSHDEDCDEDCDEGYVMDSLPEVNDGHLNTFAMIADLIEAQIPGDTE